MNKKRTAVSIASLILSFIYFFTFNITSVNASSEELISVESYATIRNDGSVDIKQTWTYDDSNTAGTEHYIDLNVDYLENPEEHELNEYISSYQVALDGRYLIFNDNWDIESSFDNKAGEYGLIKKDNGGVELTFGISKKELNKFTVEYKVHNVVKETTDGKKYLHWSFIPTDLNPKPNNMSAIIELEDDSISFDKIYGFNFSGNVQFEDDNHSKVIAIMDSNQYYSESTLNIFASINDENNIVNNTSNVEMSIDSKIEAMLDGSDYDNPNEKQKESLINKIFSLFVGFIFFIIQFIPFIIVGGVLAKSSMPLLKLKRLKSSISPEDMKEIKSKDFYRRENPEMVLSMLPVIDDILSIPDMEENFLRYNISKWTTEGVLEYIKEIEVEEKRFINKRVSKEILMKVNPHLIDENAPQLEKDIFAMFEQLADKSFLLNTRDLGSLNIERYEKLIVNNTKGFIENLEEEGLVSGEGKEKHITDDGVEIIKEHAGLRNYIKDYTLLNERNMKEIQLWDYLFHYAALYGLAEEFEKELDKLPKVVLENSDGYNRHYGSSSSAMMNARLNRAIQSQYKQHKAIEAQRARSSGSGGSSSSGGGGGSSGGGSGGGTR